MTANREPLPDFLKLLAIMNKDEAAVPKARRRKRPAPLRIVQLKISLKYIKPSIWRRVLVADNATLGELHGVIQTVVGWEDDHLHAFRTPGRGIGAMTFDNEQDNEQTTYLSEVFVKKGSKLIYEYDFGDGWEHEVILEKLIPFDAGIRVPSCVGGARACPPEDCGGVPGYYEILAALKKPDAPEYAELLEWASEYDPEAFNKDVVDQLL
jgi:hypothetical protein